MHAARWWIAVGAAWCGSVLAQTTPPLPEFVQPLPARPSRLDLNDPGCRPAYPAAALRAQVQGESHVRLQFDPRGRLLSARILREGPATPEQRLLDEAALSALPGCPFSPGWDDSNRIVGGDFDVRYRWVIEPPSPAHEARMLAMPPACRPGYPLDALRAGAQGTSALAFHLDETGQVLGVEVVRPSGDTPDHRALDSAAARALSHCPFEPARDASGRGVPGVATSSYTWRLPQPARADDK